MSDVKHANKRAETHTCVSERTETHGDTVSREDAIEAVRSLQTYKLDERDEMLLVDLADVQTELMMMPSAEPDWKKGTPLLEKREWIEGYENRWYRKKFYCASCGIKIKTESWDEKRCFGEGTILQDNNMPNFCPNCGARMERENDE